LLEEKDDLSFSSKSYSYRDDGRYNFFDGKECFYDDRGRMTSCGNTSYTYDNYGNRTSKTQNGITTNYTFTRGDLLASVNNATYTYNANGIREIKTVDGLKTKYYLDNNKILGEDRDDGDGGIIKIRYFYDKDGICGFMKDDHKYGYLKDLCGNVVGLYNASDNTYYAHYLICRYEYDAYGNCKVFDRNGDEYYGNDFIGNINPFRWKSHYFDVESGLYYANGSYYDPEVGQYVDASPIEAVEENAYVNRSLDRNNILCNNIFLLVAYLCGIFTIEELSCDFNYDASDGLPWYIKLRNWTARTLAAITEWLNGIHWAIRLAIGIILLVASIILTIATEGAAAVPILLANVAIGTAIGVASWAIMTLLAGEALTWEGALNAFVDSFLASAFTAFVNAGISGLKCAIRKSLLNHANYAQKDYSYNFSQYGRKHYSEIVGEKISNIDDLVSAIQNNKISPEQIPVEYIMKKGRPLILNTRTGNALTKAGIPRSKWHWVNKTSDIEAQKRLFDQLARNNLTHKGFKFPTLLK